VVVSKVGWNIGGVDEEGISVTENGKAGGLEPPNRKAGGGSSCRGPAVGKGGGRPVRLQYTLITNTQ
jgi:hypothetical protein